MRYLEEYKQIYNEYLSKGITPKVDDIYAEIAHNHGLKPRTISDIFNVSRKVCKIKEELYEMRH